MCRRRIESASFLGVLGALTSTHFHCDGADSNGRTPGLENGKGREAGTPCPGKGTLEHGLFGYVVETPKHTGLGRNADDGLLSGGKKAIFELPARLALHDVARHHMTEMGPSPKDDGIPHRSNIPHLLARVSSGREVGGLAGARERPKSAERMSAIKRWPISLSQDKTFVGHNGGSSSPNRKNHKPHGATRAIASCPFCGTAGWAPAIGNGS
ncbi:hypothetical protein B0I37DRAFT_355626 [Chaetomium sp. MPI-CAGE-AT-0009]|nr:hypothetical protein B0I37DRAFT_355626 [Chaetomium sp. MPI-CAGE-AT-0009]